VAFRREAPPWAHFRHPKGARARGVAYEKKMQALFTSLYPVEYVASPWFSFNEGTAPRPRWCQMDGLLFLPYDHRLVLVEYKLQHTARAYWQTRDLYLPVLRCAFPPSLWEIAYTEVCHWYDPSIPFPERPYLCPDITLSRIGSFNVHICP